MWICGFIHIHATRWYTRDRRERVLCASVHFPRYWADREHVIVRVNESHRGKWYTVQVFIVTSGGGLIIYNHKLLCYIYCLLRLDMYWWSFTIYALSWDKQYLKQHHIRRSVAITLFILNSICPETRPTTFVFNIRPYPSVLVLASQRWLQLSV